MKNDVIVNYPSNYCLRRKKLQTKISRKENFFGIIFVSIPFLGFILFSVVPIILAFITQFCSMQDYNFTSLKWNSFANFKTVFTDSKFFHSLLITVILMCSHFLSLGIALLTAGMLAQKIPGSKAFTTIYFIPYICSSVAVAMMWKNMFDVNYGIINTIIVKFFGERARIMWSAQSKAFTMMLFIVILWRSPGYGIIMYTAALTGVDNTLYEASKIDGANTWKTFTKITLPCISPTTFFLVISGIVAGMQTFDIANIFCGDSWTGAAGPNDAGLTIVLYIYNKATLFNQMPIASVMSFILFILLLIVTSINFKFSNKWVNYD